MIRHGAVGQSTKPLGQFCHTCLGKLITFSAAFHSCSPFQWRPPPRRCARVAWFKRKQARVCRPMHTQIRGQLVIGPADCNHYNCNHALFSESGNARQVSTMGWPLCCGSATLTCLFVSRKRTCDGRASWPAMIVTLSIALKPMLRVAPASRSRSWYCQWSCPWIFPTRYLYIYIHTHVYVYIYIYIIYTYTYQLITIQVCSISSCAAHDCSAHVCSVSYVCIPLGCRFSPRGLVPL